MKSWEPDQVFDKADFPAPDRKQQRKPAPNANPNGNGRTPRSGNPLSGNPGAGAQSEAARGQVISGGGQKQIKSWTPGRLGETHPARQGGTTGSTGSASGSIPQTPTSGGSRAAGGWVPDQNFKQADFPRKTEGQPSAGRGRSPAPVNQRGASSQAQGDQQDLHQRLLRELVLTFPESTVNLLRNWFWAKPGTPADNPSLAAVTGHARIFIILASVGKEVTEYIFTLMSPSERANIQTILREKYQPPPAHVQVVRRAFSEKVRGLE